MAGNYRRGKGFTIGLALGIPLGMPIGLALGNLAVGPAIGLVLGAGLGALMERSYRMREEVETPELSKKKKTIKILIISFLAFGLIVLIAIYLFAKSGQ